jgi:PKD repeat protein
MKVLFSILLLLGFTTSLFATNEKKQLQLLIRAQNGTTDQTTIYFDLGVSPAYSYPEDEPKQMNHIPGVPDLFSLSSDSVKCSIIGYSPLVQTAVIGLGVQIDSTALYTFSLTGFDNFDSTTLVILEDRQLHIFKELQVDFYTVLLTHNDTTGRFFLHVTKAVQFNTISAGCNNTNGVIEINADSPLVWNAVSVSDSGYVPLTSYTNPSGQFNFDNLPEGLYHVTLNYDNYVTTKNIQLNGAYIIVSISASSRNVAVGQNINFYSTATNTSGYIWSFGDGAIITGIANPTDVYYSAGIDTVSLLCTNSSGCSAIAQIVITVTWSAGLSNQVAKGISIISEGAKTIKVMMNDVAINDAELKIYNILGQSVYSSPVTAGQMQVSLSGQPSGIYLVSVINAGIVTTAEVYINN